MFKKMTAALLCSALLLPSVSAEAQFGGLFKKRSSTTSSTAKDKNGCGTDAGSKIGRSILGGIVGDLTRRTTRGMGVVGRFVPRAEVAGVLTDSIACRLDPEEQKQAADATLEATRGEEVGASSSWNSATRKNVSGRSTVTERSQVAGGTSCMNVTDVIIVDGEETTVSKRMCKGPGQSRYTILAA